MEGFRKLMTTSEENTALLRHREFVKVDQRYYRPAEVDQLIGDASKARRVLGWEPVYTFGELIKEMVTSDLVNVSHERSRTH